MWSSVAGVVVALCAAALSSLLPQPLMRIHTTAAQTTAAIDPALKPPLKPDAKIRLIANLCDAIGVPLVPSRAELTAKAVAASDAQAGVFPGLPLHAQLRPALLEEKSIVPR